MGFWGESQDCFFYQEKLKHYIYKGGINKSKAIDVLKLG